MLYNEVGYYRFGAELFEAVADGDVIRMQKALAMLGAFSRCSQFTAAGER